MEAAKLREQTHFRCRQCGWRSPLTEIVCSSCGADLGIFGEIISPGQEERAPAPAPAPSKQQEDSTTIVFDSPSDQQRHQEAFQRRQEEARRQWEAQEAARRQQEAQQEAARRQWEAQQAAQRQREAIEAARRQESAAPAVGKRYPVPGALCLLAGGALAYLLGYALWYQEWTEVPALPAVGVALAALTAALACFARLNKQGRLAVFQMTGLWLLPLAVYALLPVLTTGGDDYEIFVVFSVVFLATEPLLAGSAFAGVKGHPKLSAFLRWLGAIPLMACGVVFAVLCINAAAGGGIF